ncbi:conserved hypothetical protein [Thiomonas arsenitoxydans]|jgi:hypothetical protein|uniref:Uncharacterized protein n=1 Tax=Thiomonas arsenitoxydans (strain DSM 22701 / CIP 110005 / 3As) TaxID=426114 RepID=D6CMN1_THIA3|nr:hypothetical protein [Thiomonas arsenitoxydans]CAZ89809.1 hypothetical protein THI_3212 [Thiomonas arsenitoxydans]CQR39482.1 conserved hypothetical protein [Thiomonas arsenitoxydans]CQR39664.1 conserved hypothetical protein [Thiomonas arsenitoxydans]
MHKSAKQHKIYRNPRGFEIVEILHVDASGHQIPEEKAAERFIVYAPGGRKIGQFANLSRARSIANTAEKAD